MPLRWSQSTAKKFPKRSPINTLDGDLGADEMCMNDASHPGASHCLRLRNDTNSWQKEQLCVLIDHTTSSTQLVLSYQDVLSLLMCIKSLPPTKQLERGVLCKVTSTDLIFIELVVTHWFVLPATNFLVTRDTSEGICGQFPVLAPEHSVVPTWVT